MSMKILALATLAATLFGTALVQAEGSIFDDKEKMKPFYTDESMTTLRTGDDFDRVFNALPDDDKQRFRDECQNNVSQRDDYCNGLEDD